MKDSTRKSVNNNSEFEKVFHLYYSSLSNYALKFTGDKSIAEDLVQDLFIQLWERKTLARIRDIERYLLRSIKFKCIDYLKYRDTRSEIQVEEFPDEASGVLSDISEKEIEPLLHYLADKLPPKTRTVFLLSRESGLSYKEIAEEMELSVKTVESQMGRALRQLRILLRTLGFISLIPLLLT